MRGNIMVGPYKNEDEIIEAVLYWQNKALELKKQSKYYKQQSLDKDKEMKVIMKKASFITGADE
jgi:hypothetical protein